MIPFGSDVTIVAGATVPNTNALAAQVLPAGAPIGLTNTAPFFSPRGVPCTAQPVAVGGHRLPASLELVGPLGGEELLVTTAQHVEDAIAT